MTTASDATFATLASKVQELATNRYNTGRSQGRSDVTGSPNSYSLYTKSQYDSNYNSGYNAGTVAAGSLALGGFWGVQNNGNAYDQSLPCTIYSSTNFSKSGNTITVNKGMYITFSYGGNAFDASGYIEVNINGTNYNRCNITHGNSTNTLYRAYCNAGTKIYFHIYKYGSSGYSTMGLFGVACQS